MTQGPLAIIAGAGSLPNEAARLAATGRKVVILSLKGHGPPQGSLYVTDVISLFDPGAAITALKRHAPEAVLLAGSISKPSFSAMADGWQALMHREELRQILEGGDDNVLRGAIRFIERNGLRVVGIADVAPSLMGEAGLLAGAAPDDGDRRDMATGLAALGALGPFDVGQSIVVAGRRVLGVEAAEGTDALLRRIATLRRPGLVGRVLRRGRAQIAEISRGVLVKAAKPGQDRRVDQPAIGPATVELAKRAGLAGIAVEAGEVLVLERARTLARAKELGLFIYGAER